MVQAKYIHFDVIRSGVGFSGVDLAHCFLVSAIRSSMKPMNHTSIHAPTLNFAQSRDMVFKAESSTSTI